MSGCAGSMSKQSARCGQTATESTYSALFCSGDSGFCWTPAGEDGWQGHRHNLYAFVHVMSHWPAFPSILRERLSTLEDYDSEDEFNRMEKLAADFYVSTFVGQYHRLPCVPLHRLV